MLNLLDLDVCKMITYFNTINEKNFHAKQIIKWMHKNLVDDFDMMTDIPKILRQKLKNQAIIKSLPLILEKKSYDKSIKWLFGIDSKNSIETVLLPENNRITLCVSSQIGCSLNCSFCSTGKQGFNRNLYVNEIIGQLRWANLYLKNNHNKHKKITNVVMMGMGEPLSNYNNLITSLNIMLDDNAYGLSKRKVTVSTSGIIPKIKQLSKDCPVALAISLHAPNNNIRDKLVPLNKKYPLKELIFSCMEYIEFSPKNFITLEYVMLKDINDRYEHALELINLTKNLPCKFNLIPFNTFPNSNYQSSSKKNINDFKKILQDNGLIVTIRKTRGQDINAACGQLSGEVKDRTKRLFNILHS